MKQLQRNALGLLVAIMISSIGYPLDDLVRSPAWLAWGHPFIFFAGWWGSFFFNRIARP